MFDAKSVSRTLLLTTVLAVAAAPAAAVARPADNGPVAAHHTTVVYGDTTYDQQNQQDLAGSEADAPVTDAQSSGASYGVTTAGSSVPPRVDGIGQQPTHPAGRVATPVVQAPSHGGFDWTLAAVVATALLSVVLLGFAGWTTRSRRLAQR
jgi:hypothetical protein